MPFSTDSLSTTALSKSEDPIGDIAFAHKGDIYTVTVDGKHIRRLTDDGRNAFPIWSHDGSRIAFCKANNTNPNWASAELWIATSDGKYSHPITTPANLAAFYPVAWLPDDRGLVVMKVYLESDGSPTLHVVMRDGREFAYQKRWMQVSKKAGFVQQFVEKPVEFTAGDALDFSQDGGRLIFTGATEWLVDAPQLDIYRMNMDGSGIKKLVSLPDSVVYCLRWNSRSGRILSVEECWACDPRAAGILLRDDQGKRLKKLAEIGAPGYNLVDWSPDGRRIIYSQTDESYQRWQFPGSFGQMSEHSSLWIMNADGSGKYKLTDNACTPSWRKH